MIVLAVGDLPMVSDGGPRLGCQPSDFCPDLTDGRVQRDARPAGDL
jgi:hypothetical protein